jgi:hypothetical protein
MDTIEMLIVCLLIVFGMIALLLILHGCGVAVMRLWNQRTGRRELHVVRRGEMTTIMVKLYDRWDDEIYIRVPVGKPILVVTDEGAGGGMITRYRPDTDEECRSFEMIEDKEGDYVAYEDYEDELADLKAENERLKREAV